MERLQEILAILADQEQLRALTDDELAALDEELVALSEELAQDLNDENLAAIQQIADATDQVRAEAERRETAAAELEAQAAEALARIRGQQDDGAGEGDGEGGDGDGGEAGDDDGAGDGTGDDGAGDGAGDGEGDGAGTGEPASIAAGGTPTARPRLSRVAARRPAAMTPQTGPTGPVLPVEQWGLVASANVGDMRPGEPLDDLEKLAKAFATALDSTRGYKHGPPVKVPVARAGGEASEQYPAERFLDGNTRANASKIARVTDPQPIMAAGGICAPINVSYDLPIVGDDDRPVRDDALARFGADRGGVSTIPPPSLANLDNAIGIWTHANDARVGGPNAPATKPCLTITCPEEDETLVDAITLCLRTGNFRARYFPEQIAAWMNLAAVNHARVAETKLLQKIGDDSVQVDGGATVLGATRDALAILDRSVASLRSVYRITSAMPLRFIAPFWLLAMIRTDLAREMPGSTDERLAMADAEIEAFFRARGVNVTWTWDGEAGQVFDVQADGVLAGWPATVVTYLFAEGAWLFLDGGSLDLGIVRDSTLNSVNDMQMFSETFEQAHYHSAIPSWRLSMTLCPSGATSGTVDVDCGLGGS